MKSYPEIKSPEYHSMSFEEVDKIRESIKKGKLAIKINQTQIMLYLNQMNKKHSFILRLVQNTSLISFICVPIFIFINWKLSPVFFVVAIVFGSFVNKLANKYIFEECKEDRVFLKFALATELVALEE